MKKGKKILCTLLAVLLMVGSLPLAASADSAFPTSETSIYSVEKYQQQQEEFKMLESDEIFKFAGKNDVQKLVDYIDQKGLYNSETATKYYGDIISAGGNSSIITIQHYVSKNFLRFGVVHKLSDGSEVIVTFDYDIDSQSTDKDGILISCTVGISNVIMQAPFDIHSYTKGKRLSYRKIDSQGILPSLSLIYNICDESIPLSLNTFEISLRDKLGITLYNFGFINFFESPKQDIVPVSSIDFLPDNSFTVKVGGTIKLQPTISPENATYQQLLWSSSSDEIATVSQDGVVTGISPGDALIFVKEPSSGQLCLCYMTVEKPTVAGFVDVFEGDYYYDAVQWAVDNGITSGVSETSFGPNTACTRAQAVTFLWRAAGSPEPQNADAGFIDVKASDYYEKAVRWAVENGVTSGTGDGKFSPSAKCTRAQIVTFQYRAADSPSVGAAGSFGDVNSGAYYAEAVAWAVQNNITSGTGEGKFSPNNTCTRAQIVTFLYRDAQ